MIESIKKIICSTFEIDFASIGTDFSQKNCEKWDSIQHLLLMVELEGFFNLAFEPEEIVKMTSLRHIVETLESKGK